MKQDEHSSKDVNNQEKNYDENATIGPFMLDKNIQASDGQEKTLPTSNDIPKKVPLFERVSKGVKEIFDISSINSVSFKQAKQQDFKKNEFEKESKKNQNDTPKVVADDSKPIDWAATLAHIDPQRVFAKRMNLGRRIHDVESNIAEITKNTNILLQAYSAYTQEEDQPKKLQLARAYDANQKELESLEVFLNELTEELQFWSEVARQQENAQSRFELNEAFIESNIESLYVYILQGIADREHHRFRRQSVLEAINISNKKELRHAGAALQSRLKEMDTLTINMKAGSQLQDNFNSKVNAIEKHLSQLKNKPSDTSNSTEGDI